MMNIDLLCLFKKIWNDYLQDDKRREFMTVGKKYLLALASMLACCSFAGEALAVPAFSRQHKVECTTCHTIYPELNEYGDAFLKNSYVYTHTKNEVEKPATPLILGQGGDPVLLEKLKTQAAKPVAADAPSTAPVGKNEGIWLAAIPEQLPLSFTATLNASYNDDSQKNNDTDFSTRAFVMHAAGNFREKFGFFAKYTLYSEGNYNPETGNAQTSNPNVPKNNATELNELFLSWRNPGNLPLNLKIGRFKPKLSLWKSSNRTSASSLLIHSYTVGDSPFTVDSAQDCLEVNAVIANRLFAAAGIVDRDGQNNKEGYGHISYKFGGSDFAGNEPVIDFDSDSVWDYLSVMVAAYGYSGRNADIVGGVGEHFNDYYRLGLDLDLNYRKFRLKAGGVKGYDSNPYFSQVKDDINSLAVSAEAEYMFETNLIAAFRYEYLFDQTYLTERNIYVPYLAYSPLQNIRIVAEYRYEDFVTSSETDNKITNLGVSFSF